MAKRKSGCPTEQRIELYAQFLDGNFSDFEMGGITLISPGENPHTESFEGDEGFDAFVERIEEMSFDVADVEFLGESDDGTWMEKRAKKSKILWMLGSPLGHL